MVGEERERGRKMRERVNPKSRITQVFSLKEKWIYLL
jgi:hypothetical protein